MIFAVFDPSPLTMCLNCSFLHIFICASLTIANGGFNGSVQEGAFALAIKSTHFPGEIVVAR